MLDNLKNVLAPAQQERRAVGSFNVYSYETIKGVLEAGRTAGNDVIVSFGASYLKNMTLPQVRFLTETLAAGMSERVVLHLDHCEDMDIIADAIEAGFTSVMYDGSALSFEENIKNTAAVCRLAHEKNVSVEGELGSLALGDYSNETDIDRGEQYTDPDKAAEFVRRTGVDALAVSIGTVHGFYKAKPNIRLDILEKIHETVNIPLVLHGGSGTPKEILLSCIDRGICKINVNTEISKYTVTEMKKAVETDGNIHLSALSLRTAGYVKEIVSQYITLFNNSI